MNIFDAIIVSRTNKTRAGALFSQSSVFMKHDQQHKSKKSMPDKHEKKVLAFAPYCTYKCDLFLEWPFNSIVPLVKESYMCITKDFYLLNKEREDNYV